MRTFTFLEMSNTVAKMESNKVAEKLTEKEALSFAKSETERKRKIDPNDKMPIYYPIVVDDETGLYTYLNEFIRKRDGSFGA